MKYQYFILFDVFFYPLWFCGNLSNES